MSASCWHVCQAPAPLAGSYATSAGVLAALCRVEQQLSMLDSLQGLLVPRCAHAAAATAQATPPQSDYPTVLSYMASSRFGSPSVLTAYARQVLVTAHAMHTNRQLYLSPHSGQACA